MPVRPRAALVGVGLFAAACASSPQETVPYAGEVRQHGSFTRSATWPALDLVVVLNTPSTPAGAALRLSAARALGEAARRLGEPHDLWRPADLRAFVTSTADGATTSPFEQPALAWHEAKATSAASDVFATALESAIAQSPAATVRADGVLDALRATLARAGAPAAGAIRYVVLVTTEDDPSASRTRELAPLDEVLVVVPDDAVACTHVATPRLEAWATVNGGGVRSPCGGVEVSWPSDESSGLCLPAPPSASGDALASCRVVAFVPRGTACDPARGWGPLARPVVRNDASVAGMDACEVLPLAGDDALACRDLTPWSVERSSGWCLPSVTAGCASRWLRIVGGAAPSWALLYRICNLTP